MNSKQITFPRPTTCTHVLSDGSSERVRYGQYESIVIVSENGWPLRDIYENVPMTPPRHEAKHVVKTDGTKVIFDEPFYLTRMPGGKWCGLKNNQI